MGTRREVPQGRQRIPVAGAAAAELCRRQGDVLAAREVVIPEAVRGLGDSAEVIDGGVEFPRSVSAGVE